jgi:hypothetical protein
MYSSDGVVWYIAYLDGFDLAFGVNRTNQIAINYGCATATDFRNPFLCKIIVHNLRVYGHVCIAVMTLLSPTNSPSINSCGNVRI